MAQKPSRAKWGVSDPGRAIENVEVEDEGSTLRGSIEIVASSCTTSLTNMLSSTRSSVSKKAWLAARLSFTAMLFAGHGVPRL